MKNLNNEKKWNNLLFWNDYCINTKDYQERLNTIINLIPEDVKSIIDIGCGKGEIINYLKNKNNKKKIMGVDISDINKKHITTKFLIGKLPKINVKNKSYDLVLCLEVLEHINSKNYYNSLDEIERIAKKYIIIGVPYNENLDSKKIKCNICKNIFHVDGHLKSFKEKDIINLFNKFVLKERLLIGKPYKRKIKLLDQLNNFIDLYYQQDNFFCPYCNKYYKKINKISILKILLRKIITLIHSFFLIFKKYKPYWIIALYKRVN